MNTSKKLISTRALPASLSRACPLRRAQAFLCWLPELREEPAPEEDPHCSSAGGGGAAAAAAARGRARREDRRLLAAMIAWRRLRRQTALCEAHLAPWRPKWAQRDRCWPRLGHHYKIQPREES